MSDDIEVSVIVPAYNEQGAVVGVLQDLHRVMQATGRSYEILLVDDGSTDETVPRGETVQDVQVISHGQNRGTGAARTTGVRASRGRLLVMIDADDTYPVESIPAMLEQLESCDMVIGARTREAGTMKWLRTFAKESIRLLACYLTETRIPDLNSGLRAMRRELVEAYLPLLPNTHSWVSTITMAALSGGYHVEWLPIEYRKRIGRSTFHPIRDTYNYLVLVIRSIMYFNPLKVFLPASAFLFLAGFGKAFWDFWHFGLHVASATVMVILAGVQILALGFLGDLIARRGRH
ncbi:MAG: glycosyltransferase family 2 protein [Anaerolineae bacterium]|jgi:glycosyltransferase involved in cell wall biosynthesis